MNSVKYILFRDRKINRLNIDKKFFLNYYEYSTMIRNIVLLLKILKEDEIMEILKLKKSTSFEEKKDEIKKSLINGFFSTSAIFPVVSFNEGIEISLDELVESRKKSLVKNVTSEEYVSSTKSSKEMNSFDWRKKKGLESLFEKGLFLEDKNLDQLPDYLNLKIVLPNNCDNSTLLAICNFAFRFGMEMTEINTNIIADENSDGNLLKFVDSDETKIEIVEKEDKNIVIVSGRGEKLEKFSSYICQNLPIILNGKTLIDVVKEMLDAFDMRNLDGQLTYAKDVSKIYNGEITAYVSPEIDFKSKNIDDVNDKFANIEFKNHKGLKPIYEKNYDLKWEVDEFRERFSAILDQISKNDNIEIYAALSESDDVRRNLENELKRLVLEKGAKLVKNQIVCAYKQGFSWLDEFVSEEIKNDDIESIDIKFKPFLPEGQTEIKDDYKVCAYKQGFSWLDEFVSEEIKNDDIESIDIKFKPFLPEGQTEIKDDYKGATPSYNNIGEENPDNWFDIPIRFLQELYPIDDILSEKLNLNREVIKFSAYSEDKDITYCAKVFLKSNECKTFEYKVRYSERPYLDEYKSMGKVHPSTGYIKVVKNNKILIDERIKTDLENIWDIYQGEVLPECLEFAKKKTDNQVNTKNQPFFAQLRLDITASEPEKKLTCREDMISSLNSLHEDLYFVGSDYFKNYGVKNNKEIIDAPGLILPVLKTKEGKPEFKVTLYDQLEKEPCIKYDGKILKSKYDRKSTSLYLKEIKLEENKIIASFMTNIDDDSLVKSYLELLQDDVLDISKDLYGIDRIEISNGYFNISADIKEKEHIEKDLSIEDINIYENELIGYEQYIEIIEQLKRVKGLKVYKAANSYMGRKVYVVEFEPKEEGYISRVKRINNLPSEIINSRHHANEVSSTNSAFMLIKELLTNKKYKDLPDKINLSIIPMENVDGSAIHYELQKDNPNWKLHVARFNSIGKEFYYEYFNVDTIHTEAMAFTNLWEKWLPDIVVDNHGVPSHEWEQQFSGYTSPSYKGFWLPRALLYGYFWVVTDEEYKDNYLLNKKIEDVIAQFSGYTSPSYKGFWLPRALLYGYFWVVTDEEYKDNYLLNKKIEDVIADSVQKNEEITKFNKEWISVFEKFAHAWMPNLFPADYYRDMINYWIYFSYDKNHRYPSIKIPWITTVSYTSEVADETAHGEYLNTCAKAHKEHDLAVIDMLFESEINFDRAFNLFENNLELKNTRQRPIMV